MAPPKGGKKIIIVKKKISGGGHHGGAWKVAYADFVTAMMAFFMVMWILGMDDKTKKAIEGYFSNPVGYKKGYGAGSSALFVGSSPTTIQRPSLKSIVRTSETRTFEALKSRIEAKLAASDSLKHLKAIVSLEVTAEGLRIELLESGNGDQYFELGSARMKPATALVLQVVGTELALLTTPLVLEGHTDAAQFGRDAAYGNWDLSTERALAARRELATVGIGDNRIIEVVGYGATKLRDPANPTAAANRRISILLPFSTKVPDGDGSPESVANGVRDSILAGFAPKLNPRNQP
jgi:chemotaxis protein MotB